MTHTKTFVLVHGSWHGAWCWARVLPALREEHEAVAVELPAHGSDPAGVEAATFERYVDRVGTAVDAAVGEVVLVGHSMGGHVVTQVAERHADAVAAVVYLAAFLPGDGQSLTDLDAGAFDSAVPEHIVVDDERGVVTFEGAGADDTFYQDCSERDAAFARSRLRPEPAAPRHVPVSLSEQRYGAVPRVYIECTEDRALPVAFQRSMYEAVGCDAVHSLETGHAPFLAAPTAVAETLRGVTE
ncbi:alpha/beta fold hydrolase [Halolamina litorea]|uniref:Alpha/beta fold hydrolase n=1 Tax=Halolamina litorea TaxID=1515593 RepID=A0ABD6BUI2_9EURY|nr:alpha/beta fold hydrolase [Halolamina litorea]